MKILFHNYTNSLSTEPMYLNTALLNCGINSELWANNDISAFDVFDRVKPDVFVTHFTTLTLDIMTYLQQNKGIDTLINVTGASNAQLKNIKDTIDQFGIKLPFAFTNSVNGVTENSLKVHNIYPAADIFNSRLPQTNHMIKEAIISNKFDEKIEDFVGEKDVFHLLYIGDTEKESSFDIKVNILSLSRLYDVYEKMVIFGGNDLCCSQLFFDASLHAKNIEVKSTDQEGFYKFLEKVFKDSNNSEDIGSEIKSQIKNRHTPFHRAWTLMKHLQNKDAMANIEKVKEKLPELLKDK